MIFNNFQRKLRQEAQLWRDEGIISSSQHEQIAKRYQLNNLEESTRDGFSIIAITVGGLLLGLGLMTLVGANWQGWSREVKFILLMSLFLSTAITGFLTWREPTLTTNQSKKSQQSKRILGEALLILSAFILGATLMSMGQIFNISSSASELFLAWGFGVLVMAYSLSLNSLGIMAIILIQIGYWIGIGDLWSVSGEVNWARIAVRHMPLLSWLLFLPLAYICRSRWIFGIGVLAFILSLQYNLNPLPLLTFSDVIPWTASFALALPPALLWSYDDLLFPTVNYRLFQPLARNFGLICFGVVFYLLSFRWQWQAVNLSYDQPNNLSNVFQSLPIIDLGILSGLAVLQWLFLVRHRNSPLRREVFFKIVIITTFLSFILITPFWHQAITRITELGIFIFNILLAILAWGLIQEGFNLRNRTAFWCGMLLFTLQIISRVLEYNTDVLFRALVFASCGYSLIAAGLWFERHFTTSKSGNNQK
ncbi:DUF2157 domain-containing protein [Dolichospermum sp. FACHB-1091]|uniref:DUF2157 domain-containing protein n=1 Tax=Dolichospermum sp. FACHB-1091 TaxID=2692798 RepID=UPI0016812D80|nr:DUF2157 domain-containing protein [Dolichospermum sp. FACHB-1091]MBD2443725.1 DUF2157 domain-containing protein [Dolichospermum sp. FACHB-1091]